MVDNHFVAPTYIIHMISWSHYKMEACRQVKGGEKQGGLNGEAGAGNGERRGLLSTSTPSEACATPPDASRNAFLSFVHTRLAPDRDLAVTSLSLFRESTPDSRRRVPEPASKSAVGYFTRIHMRLHWARAPVTSVSSSSRPSVPDSDAPLCFPTPHFICLAI